MKRIHLLRVEEPAAAFAGLVLAARADGLRTGWLDLAAGAGEPAAPHALAPMAAAGALRAVTVGAAASLAYKPLAGPPVFRDLVREHFLGCALVLVRVAEGDERFAELAAATRLAPTGDGWRVTVPGEAAVELDTAELVGRLRKPRPW